jgi:hypothetical protein
MWRKLSSIFILTFILSVSTVAVNAQVVCSGDPDDPGFDPNGCNLPLDTWVAVLVIAAVIFGAYKLYQKQKALVA